VVEGSWVGRRGRGRGNPATGSAEGRPGRDSHRRRRRRGPPPAAPRATRGIAHWRAVGGGEGGAPSFALGWGQDLKKYKSEEIVAEKCFMQTHRSQGNNNCLRRLNWVHTPPLASTPFVNRRPVEAYPGRSVAVPWPFRPVDPAVNTAPFLRSARPPSKGGEGCGFRCHAPLVRPARMSTRRVPAGRGRRGTRRGPAGAPAGG